LATSTNQIFIISTTMASLPTSGTFNTEGCNLHYWYQGAGPLLVFVPGGNGHGRQYNAIMGILDTHYTVATFDRRQMSASTVQVPQQEYNLVLQARDIIAVIRAVGFQKASIFASSGGGVIAFQLAVSYPEVVENLVSHEAPTTTLLSAAESTDLMDFFSSMRVIYRNHGPGPTMKAFVDKIMVGMDDGLPLLQPEAHNVVNQLENESWMGSYCPDLVKIVDNGTSVAVGFGTKSAHAMFKRTVREQAKRLKCEKVEFPGHHQGFETQPAEFAPVLLALLKRMEDKRQARLEGGEVRISTAENVEM
jgi:pimeloyl-ACP methyl ester carboxylesterase